jgi:hypothetical protein
MCIIYGLDSVSDCRLLSSTRLMEATRTAIFPEEHGEFDDSMILDEFDDGDGEDYAGEADQDSFLSEGSDAIPTAVLERIMTVIKPILDSLPDPRKKGWATQAQLPPERVDSDAGPPVQHDRCATQNLTR